MSREISVGSNWSREADPDPFDSDSSSDRCGSSANFEDGYGTLASYQSSAEAGSVPSHPIVEDTWGSYSSWDD